MNTQYLLSSDESLRAQTQAHIQAQHWPQAWDALQVLAALAPQDAWVQQWRVVAALAVNQPVMALQAAHQALELLPEHHTQARAQVLFNLAQAHAQLGQHGPAGKALTRMLQISPATPEALTLLANCLLKADAPARALQVFLQLEQSRPTSPFVACMVVFLSRQLAQWRWPSLPVSQQEHAQLTQPMLHGLSPELALLASRASLHMPALEPFATLVLYDDPALQYHVAQYWLQHQHPPVLDEPAAACTPLALPPCTAAGGPPLKVAYVSCEFLEHATSYLLAGVLARHHPARVQVVLIHFAPPPPQGKPDAMQQRLAAMGHQWVDAHAWSDAQVAQWCREQGVHVAVDLKGLTRDARPGIFARRAAPVQVNWLGYPGTLPAPYYDWVLADAHVLPPTLEPHFAEKVWRLPHSYQPNDPDRPIDPTPQHRAQHGLPEQGPVLVCFNNSFKLTPQVWGVWMRLLKARPDAVLWLLEGAPEWRHNLCSHATQAGVAPQRLVFAPKMPQAQHLARLQLADLSLDTLPYNAHTTASDALWAGVPHVACAGHSFAARVGASVLAAAGVPELVAYGLEQYEALALSLLLNDASRAAVRQRLAEQRATASLWDAQAFASALEDAYEGMCAAAAAGAAGSDLANEPKIAN